MDAAAAVQAIARRTGPGCRVFVGGGPTEPLLFAEAFRSNPETASGLQFAGVWLPGINRTDWSELGPGATAESIFLSPAMEAAHAAGRLHISPSGYFQTARWLAETPLHAALVQVSAPDEIGECSFGPCADFAPDVLTRQLLRVAHVNLHLPRLPGPTIPLSRFDIVVSEPRPFTRSSSDALDASWSSITERLSELIPKGATVQFGLGKVAHAAVSALTRHTGLRIRSGLLSEAALDLLDGNVLVAGPDAMVAGVVLASDAACRRHEEDARLRLAPVSETHDPVALAAIPNFVAINSALEVDLSGQVNAEFVGSKQVSGVGGLGDFLLGARLSRGGTPIIALPATAKAGRVSRIVTRLTTPSVSISRSEVGVVVTEHGVADLRGMSLAQRAEALVAIAAPEHREALDSGRSQSASMAHR